MKVGIIGAGTMGAGIAQVAAEAGHAVYLFDTKSEALEKAEVNLDRIMTRLIAKGKRTEEQALETKQRITYITEMSHVQDAGLVIEAIVEDLSIKQSVFSTLEDLVSSECILATNTSSLSVTSIAGSCRQADRIIGIHFFNPAPLMKLVEIVPAIQTSPDVLTTARGIIDSWGKLTVVAKDTPGFIVNRVARPFYSESIRIYEEGIADFTTIDWAMTELAGFRMGPFTLMDYIGNDVNYAVTESVWRSCYLEPRYKPSFTQKRLVEAGYLGRKANRGYYDYSDDAKAEVEPDKEVATRIVDRVLSMLINEAADAVFWGVAGRDDIDLAMTKGVNYPKGLLQWADEIGIEQIVSNLDALFDEYHEERYRCSVLLRRMATSGDIFYKR